MLAEFLIAYKKTGGFEGGWNHVPGDRGGETYCGIARKVHPKWEGWAIVDAHKPLKHNQIINNEELAQMVKNFYRKNYWVPVWGDKFKNQEAANQLYDMAVNAGVGAAVRIAERQYHLPETGKMNIKLFNLINNS